MDIIARIDAVREQVAIYNGGQTVRRDGESWRDFIDEGRRIEGQADNAQAAPPIPGVPP